MQSRVCHRSMAGASGGLSHAHNHEFGVVLFASGDSFHWSLVHRSTFERGEGVGGTGEDIVRWIENPGLVRASVAGQLRQLRAELSRVINSTPRGRLQGRWQGLGTGQDRLVLFWESQNGRWTGLAELGG